MRCNAQCTYTNINIKTNEENEWKNKQTKSVTPNNLWLILNELNVKACWIFYQNIKHRLALGNMNRGKTALDNHCMHIFTVVYSNVYVLLLLLFIHSWCNYFWCVCVCVLRVSCRIFNFTNKYSNLIWIFRARLSVVVDSI